VYQIIQIVTEWRKLIEGTWRIRGLKIVKIAYQGQISVLANSSSCPTKTRLSEEQLKHNSDDKIIFNRETKAFKNFIIFLASK
jgi:hypothetical protein